MFLLILIVEDGHKKIHGWCKEQIKYKRIETRMGLLNFVKIKKPKIEDETR